MSLTPRLTPKDSGKTGRRRTQQVLDAVASVFASKGFPATATQDIADVLGMRQASLYYYFDSKQTALEQVCSVGVQEMLARARSATKGQKLCSGKLERLVAGHLDMMRDRSDYVRVFLHERRHLDRTRQRHVWELARRIEAVFRRVFADGVRRGEFRSDLDINIATLTVLGMLNTATAWHGREHRMSVEQLNSQLTSLVLRGVVADCLSRSSRIRRVQARVSAPRHSVVD
jgi:TetR/AcrR family transcriptional regulator, cholesterol catabolism regulator